MLNPTPLEQLEPITSMLGMNLYVFLALLIPVTLIVYILVGIFLGGTIFNVFLRWFNGQGTRRGTISVMSYSSAIMLVSWIPYIGWILGLYGLYIALTGYSKIHKISITKVIWVIIVQFIVVMVILLIINVGLAYLMFMNL